LSLGAGAVNHAPAAVGEAAANFGRARRRRAAAPLVADLPLPTRRDAGAGWAVAGQALVRGAVAAVEGAAAAVGEGAAPPCCARPRGTAAAGPGADLAGVAGVIAGATVLRVSEIGALIATADVADRAARPHAAGPAKAALRATAAVPGIAAGRAAAAGLAGLAALSATAVAIGAADRAAAALPGGAAADLKAEFGARPAAAALPRGAGVAAGAAVSRVGLEVGARSGATGLPGAAAAAMEDAAAAVGRAAALPGLARRKRAAGTPIADLAGSAAAIEGAAAEVGEAAAFPGLARRWSAAGARIADLAGGAGGTAGAAVGRVGLEVGARPVAAVLAGGAVSAGHLVQAADAILARLARSTACHIRPAAAEPALVALTGAERGGPRARRVALGLGRRPCRVALGLGGGARLFGRSTSRLAPVAGRTRRQAVTAAAAVRGNGAGPAHEGGHSRAGQTGKPPENVTAGDPTGKALRQGVEPDLVHDSSSCCCWGLD
jgi:hypothetical protein